MSDLAWMTIAEVSARIRRREVSPVELVRETLARIETLGPRLNAFITVLSDSALEEARQAEREIAAGRCRGPLHGIPYAAKDLLFTKGVRTTAGTKFLTDFKPDFDAAVIEKLRQAGAVLVGKANLHENAYGITSNNPHYGPVRNPWDLDRIPGGSSGGSTAALAAGLCGFSLGTDTGGSIRIPAAFCGVTGLKPTFGRVSRIGCFPLGHTLDHIGPFARTAEDAGWAYAAMAGFDPREDSSVDRPVELPEYAAEPDLRGVRFGVPDRFYFEDLDSEVEVAARAAIAAFESLGAEAVEVAVPDIEEFNVVARLILLAEATSVHQRTFDQRRDDYGEDQRALLDQGRFVLASDYLNAQRRRREFCEAFNRLLENVDWIIAPAVPVPPARIGETTIEVNGREVDVRLATTRNARALNLTGLPLLTLPCGFTAAGLPIGVQLIGRSFDEKTILEAGHAYQRATDWTLRRPPLG